MSLEVVAIAADHAGFSLKQELAELLTSSGYQVLDLGTNSGLSVDYPDFAQKMAEAIRAGTANRGVLVCGSGIGIGIAANRFPGVRAATCTSATLARLARAHNDANVISLGASIIGFETARVFAKFGATVFVTARSLDKANKAADAIRALVPDADLKTLALDLSSLKDVKRAADEFLALKSPLHLLINNAGQS